MSLLTCRSHFSMILRISLFLPVRIDTFSHTLVASYRSMFAFSGPQVCPLMVIPVFMRCSFYGVTRPWTFTRQTLVRLATGFSSRPLSVLSLVTRRRPSELKSSLPTVMRWPQRAKVEGKRSQMVGRFWGSRWVQMQPLGLLIIHSLEIGFCICRPTGVKAFRFAYTGTSIFSNTRFPSTRTSPSWINSSASRREQSAFRLIHFDSRTISRGCGELTISPKASACLHSSLIPQLQQGFAQPKQWVNQESSLSRPCLFGAFFFFSEAVKYQIMVVRGVLSGVALVHLPLISWLKISFSQTRSFSWWLWNPKGRLIFWQLLPQFWPLMLSWLVWGRLFSEPFTAASMVEESLRSDLAQERISCLLQMTSAYRPIWFFIFRSISTAFLAALGR